jgi:hypothetical protein
VAATDAPLRALGSTNASWGNTYGYGAPTDPLEHVPELVFPASIPILAKMRTDATIASALAAYVTALVAAEWHIDPAGSTPAMARLCADSLGLPIAGEDPEQIGATRARGVKWKEHVRLMCLHLVYGFMPFEPVYEIRDGKTYLRYLAERMPSTIVEVKVNEDGTLKSIVQEGVGKNALPNGVEIPADRLIWYVSEREGANWTGRPLIRACYSAWLLKLDTLRVNAVSIARFGAGTPVMEPLPGTSPTTAQVIEAQRLASSVRVGQTGGAVPNGFTLRIKGVEGSIPDAIPTLRMYDEQLSRALLTSILDLGNTANGSRALGDNFADILQRSLQSIGDAAAETATQLCERLTSFNEGEDAISPIVRCGDVGASKAVIAQSITGLVQAGIVTPDASLDAYARDAYNLPAATPAAAVSTVDDKSTDLCGQPKADGEPCTRPAGWGTDHPGSGPCEDHDGSKTKAADRNAREGVSAAANDWDEPDFSGGCDDPDLSDVGWAPWVSAKSSRSGSDAWKRNAGNIAPIIKWFESGEGAARIQWGRPGDFDRCRNLANNHMSQHDASGFCANRHKSVTGEWPGPNAHGGKKRKGKLSAAEATPYREPTPEEQAAGLDPAAIQEEEDGLVAEGMALFAAIVVAWGAALAAQILAALVAGSLIALARLKLTTGDAVEALQLVMREAAEVGARQVLNETTRAGANHGLRPADVDINTAELDELAEALAEHTTAVLAGTAGREAQRLGTAPDEAEVDELISRVTTGPVSALVAEAVARAMAGGRVEAMEAVIAATPGIEWILFHSAVRDRATCTDDTGTRCLERDGTEYPDLAAARLDFPLGIYRNCKGRDRCRCLIAARPIR